MNITFKSVVICVFNYKTMFSFACCSILRNVKKLLRNFEYSKSLKANEARPTRSDTSAFDLPEIRGPHSDYASSPEVVSWVTNTAHQKKNKQKPLNTAIFLMVVSCSVFCCLRVDT